MTDPTHEIILHNYPQSPVAEKVRVALGIKGLSWRSVEIPRLPPKPMLTRLTGGYRRTPVMQIGADIFCDSQCIIRELEQRYPEPSFFPHGDEGLLWCFSRWADGALFDLAVKLVLGAAGDDLPKDFAEDRGRLYLGPDWAAGLAAANAALPHLASQMRAPLGWLDDLLSDGRNFLRGAHPSMTDAQIYYVVWFIRGRWAQGPAFLSEFAHLTAWEARLGEIGHGSQSPMSPEDAIIRAAACTPAVAAATDPNDPQGLAPGTPVVVRPDVDGGEQPVAGTVHAVSRDTLTVLREEPDVGKVAVHFPRAGYRVERG